MKNKYLLSTILVLFTFGIVYAEGSYVTVWNEDLTNINETIIIHGIFFNNGNKTVNASFVGDIYFGAEKVYTFNTEPKEIKAGANATFATEFTPHNLGRYNVKGFVVYGDELTSTSDSHFSTMASTRMVPFATSYAIFALIGIVVAVVLVKLLMNRGKGELVHDYDHIKVYKNEKYKL
jgi:hypothetical protein